MTLIIHSIDEAKQHAGEHLGYSDWRVVDQDQVNLFADATDDHQWIHVDLERAAAGPFGGTIAHGYLSLSMIPSLLKQVLDVDLDAIKVAINYGCNRVRWPSPLKVGSKVRLGAKIASVEDLKNPLLGDGIQMTVEIAIESEGEAKPNCVAQVLYHFYPG
jgi:acyl dehydratase